MAPSKLTPTTINFKNYDTRYHGIIFDLVSRKWDTLSDPSKSAEIRECCLIYPEFNEIVDEQTDCDDTLSTSLATEPSQDQSARRRIREQLAPAWVAEQQQQQQQQQQYQQEQPQQQQHHDPHRPWKNQPQQQHQQFEPDLKMSMSSRGHQSPTPAGMQSRSHGGFPSPSRMLFMDEGRSSMAGDMAGPSRRDNVHDPAARHETARHETARQDAGQETTRLKKAYRDAQDAWRSHMRLAADAEVTMAEIMLQLAFGDEDEVVAREPFFGDDDSDADTINGADGHGKRGPRYERNQRKREKAKMKQRDGAQGDRQGQAQVDRQGPARRR